MNSDPTGVSFDLFGTLVAVDRPEDPAAAVAGALADRGVAVPDGWVDAYRKPHLDVVEGRELPLTDHVGAALRSRGVEPEQITIDSAVRSAFDGPVRTREGAADAVAASADRGPVGLLSNCSVPGLVERTLERSAVPTDWFDSVVTSVDCGWRKPDPRAFETAAEELGVPPERLVHVGDDPETDGGVEAVGGTFVSIMDHPLPELPARLEGRPWA